VIPLSSFNSTFFLLGRQRLRTAFQSSENVKKKIGNKKRWIYSSAIDTPGGGG
jgi:hypothetical protein